MEKNSKPKVRFKECTEEWEKSEFEDIFNNISNNSLSRDQLNYHIGDAKNIHYGDILVKYSEILDVDKEVIPFISDNEAVEKIKNSRLLDGDIIIADAAEDEMVGKCVEIINIKNNVVVSGLHTIAVRPKNKFAPRYLGYYMNSNAYHQQLLKLMQGTKVLSISKTAIKKTFVNHPKSEKEQLKIGNLFENIDKLIAGHRQKHSKLKALKKAMSSKMFPQQGQTIPEVRFKGFAGNWKEDNLSELSFVFDGTHQTPTYTESGVMFLSVENISNLTSKKYISRKAFEEEFSNYPENGDVLMTRIGDVGTTNVVETNEPLAYYVSLALLKKKKLDPYFLKECIGSEKVKKELWHRTLHIAFPKKINKNEIEKVTIPYPVSEEEQKKVGELFKQINKLIICHQSEMDRLDNIKQAFLAKMFI